MKKFNVTFKESKKYNPATRTVMVVANDEFHAKDLVYSEFGSFRFDTKLNAEVPSDTHIKVTNVKEIKEKKGE
jgi:ribosomal protein L20A (L18A)